MRRNGYRCGAAGRAGGRGGGAGGGGGAVGRVAEAATGLGLFARGRRRLRARLRWQKGASDAPLAGPHPSRFARQNHVFGREGDRPAGRRPPSRGLWGRSNRPAKAVASRWGTWSIAANAASSTLLSLGLLGLWSLLLNSHFRARCQTETADLSQLGWYRWNFTRTYRSPPTTKNCHARVTRTRVLPQIIVQPRLSSKVSR